jgi:Transglycosylase-like domain/Putative peptidoglycan binding domain
MSQHVHAALRRRSARAALALAGAAAVATGGVLVAGTGVASASSGWAAVAQCESGGDAHYNDGQFYGLYNFDRATWQALGYSGTADQYSASVQTEAAERLYAQRGAQPWPVCGKYLSGGAGNVSSGASTSSSVSSSALPENRAGLLGAWLVQQRRSDVRHVQVALRQRGYHLVIDGQYGPQTAAVVKRFQDRTGLVVDGVFGPQTKSRLLH